MRRDGTVVNSWEELRKGEKTWNEMRWDEMGWHRLRRQRDAMSNFQEKLRCDEIKWNDIEKIWHWNEKSRDCRCKAQKACRRPIDTVLFPLYRLYALQFWNFHPWLCRVLLVYTSTSCAFLQTQIDDGRQLYWYLFLSNATTSKKKVTT